jgi:hypothetical protein
MSEGIFNIISENEEVKHVTQQVNPPCVHEHRCEDRVEPLTMDYVVRDHHKIVLNAKCKPVVKQDVQAREPIDHEDYDVSS